MRCADPKNVTREFFLVMVRHGMYTRRKDKGMRNTCPILILVFVIVFDGVQCANYKNKGVHDVASHMHQDHMRSRTHSTEKDAESLIKGKSK